jgi:low affinity Fe/Cu permease
MVFLIQNTQNRDGAAMQAKLDELIRTSAAQNASIGIEHLPQEEVETLRERCAELAKAHASAAEAGTKAVERANKSAADAAEGVHGF